MVNIFPTPEVASTPSIFPEEATDKLYKERREFIISLAERYADKTGLPVTEAVAKAEFEGSGAIVPDETIDVTERDVFEDAYAKLKTPEQVKESLDNYVKNRQIFATAREDVDVAEKIVTDPMSMTDVRLMKIAKLRTAIQKIMPERTILNTTFDFLGYLGREVTYGSLENFAHVLGIGGKTAREQDWYKRLFDSPIEETDAVAEEIAKEIADFGLIGNNSFYLAHLSEGALAGGATENETMWAAIDLATLGAGKALKTVKATSEAATASRIATAVDPADMNIATKGVSAGDSVVQKAIINGEETAVELTRQTAPGISRVGIVNAENAIAPTLKPVYDAEAAAKVNSVLSKTLKIYGNLKATNEEILANVTKYIEDYTRTTSYGLLNVTRDIPIVKAPIKATGKAPKTAGPLLEGVKKDIYAKALSVVKDNLNAGRTFSLTDFMKVSGLKKEETFLYKKQLIQDGVINSANKILSEKPVAAKTVEAFEEVTKPVTATDIGGFNSYELTAYLGKADGTPFKTEEAGMKAASQMGGTLVRLVDGYVVKMSRNLPIEFSPKSSLTQEQQELRTFLFETLLSPEVTSNLATEALIKSGTSKLNAVGKQVSRDLGKSLYALNRTERRGLGSVLNEISNDYARKTWYNEAEFSNSFYKHTGMTPSEKVLKAYQLRADLYEAGFILRADEPLKSYSAKGYFIGRFKGSKDTMIKKVEQSLADDIDIWDYDTGALVKVKDIKGKAIYELTEDEGLTLGSYKQYYVTGSLENNRGLTHADVLGYKPGANRALPNVSHLVVQENTAETISGVKRNLTPKTVLAERTEQLTQKAADEINNILRAVRDVSRSDVQKIRAAVNLNDVIKTNNGFNPNIENIDDFLKFMDDAGLGYDDVKVVASGSSFDGRTYSQIYDLNTNPVRRRADLILHGYGAKGIRMRNPFEAIEREFTRGVNIAATTRYLDTAIPNFLKDGEQYIKNFKSIENLPNIQKIREAVIDTSTVKGRAFAREQNVILSRISEQSNVAKTWERMMVDVNQKIFKTFGKEEINLGFKKFSTMDYLSSDPTTAIRGFAFHARMGFLAVDQLYVQSLNALNIISLHPVEGFRAAASYRSLRAAMMNRNPEVLKELARRSAGPLNMTEDEFLELTDHLYYSGRFEIGDTIADVGGNGMDFGIGFTRNAKEVSTLFFKAGERFPRTISHFVAYKEFKKKFPNLNTKTPEGQRIMDEFMTNYSEALVFNMNSVSNAGWQQGFTGLMTQWLSYNARFMETVFFGRTFTKRQRGQLALAQLVFYGMQGAGLGYVLDATLNRGGIELDNSIHTGIKQGMLDYFLSEITGVSTNLSSRLAPGQGVVDYAYKWFDSEESALSLLGGPGTSISLDFLSRGFDLLKTIVTGDVTLSKINFELMMREIKTIDKTYQTMYALNSRDILTKSGFEQIRDASNMEIFLNSLSVPLKESQIGFNISNAIDKQKTYTQEMARKAKDLYRRMNDAFEAGDLQTAEDLANTINGIRMGITFSERKNFDFFMRESVNSFTDTMIQKAYKYGLETQATQSKKVIEE